MRRTSPKTSRSEGTLCLPNTYPHDMDPWWDTVNTLDKNRSVWLDGLHRTNDYRLHKLRREYKPEEKTKKWWNGRFSVLITWGPVHSICRLLKLLNRIKEIILWSPYNPNSIILNRLPILKLMIIECIHLMQCFFYLQNKYSLVKKKCTQKVRNNEKRV